MHVIDPTARGAIVQVLRDPSGPQGGFIKVQGLQTGTASGGTVMLVGASLGGMDSVDPIDALDDKHVLDVFGPVFKPVQIIGVIFIKQCSGGVGKGVDIVRGFFDSKRVSKSKSAVNVSVGNYKKGVYITSLQMGQADPVTNTMSFTLEGIEKPRK